jgi:hypothetical protein
MEDRKSNLAINKEEGSMKKITISLMVAVSVFFVSDCFAQGVSPQRVALLRWYGANQAGIQFSVGSGPQGIAFDGAYIWVANSGMGTVTSVANSGMGGAVTRLRASDGTNWGTFTVGNQPRGIAFDGANIWVTNNVNNSVSKF